MTVTLTATISCLLFAEKNWSQLAVNWALSWDLPLALQAGILDCPILQIRKFSQRQSGLCKVTELTRNAKVGQAL